MRRAGIAAAEKNAVAVRRVNPSHLRDRAFHLAALRYREARILETVFNRLRKRLSNGLDPGEAVLELQEHLVALAWAHADRLALEWFDEQVMDQRAEKITDSELRRIYPGSQWAETFAAAASPS